MIDRKNSGFSLIELMVVISIIATMVSLAVPTMKNFQDRARDAEAPLNVRHMVSLLVAYVQGENDPLIGGGMANSVFVRNDFSTETSCDNSATVPNPIGFRLTDCRKIGFLYGYYWSGTNKALRGWALEAGTAGNKRVYRRSCGSSYWVADVGNLTQVFKPSYGSAVALSTFNSSISAKIGSTSDPIIDFSGNGTVEGGEYGLIIGPISAPVIVGTLLTHLGSCP